MAVTAPDSGSGRDVGGTETSSIDASLRTTVKPVDAGAVDIRCAVTSGAASINASAPHATAYRTVAEAPRNSMSATAVTAPISAPCQVKCSSAQPMASVRG